MDGLRNFFRSRYINPTTALLIKNKLSIIYGFTAWNILIYTLVQVLKNSTPEKEGDTDYAKLMKQKNVSIVTISGFGNVMESKTVHLDDSEIEKYHAKIGQLKGSDVKKT